MNVLQRLNQLDAVLNKLDLDEEEFAELIEIFDKDRRIGQNLEQLLVVKHEWIVWKINNLMKTIRATNSSPVLYAELVNLKKELE